MTAVRTSVLPPYAAHLRVYEPLAALPEPDRAHWQAELADRGPDATSADQPVARAALEAQREALAELLPRPARSAPRADRRPEERAFVRVVDSVAYVCPWATLLRSRQALEELRESLPEALLDSVLPRAVREEAPAAQAGRGAVQPDARPWILTSRWEVPVRWFLPFGPEDRRYVPATGPGAGERAAQPAALYYLTTMAQARRRVARGYRVLKERLGGSVLAEGVEEVGRWLEEFHPRSLVELDYGGLVHVMGERALAADQSAGELADGLAALRAGDAEGAARVYETVTERWRRVQALRQAN